MTRFQRISNTALSSGLQEGLGICVASIINPKPKTAVKKKSVKCCPQHSKTVAKNAVKRKTNAASKTEANSKKNAASKTVATDIYVLELAGGYVYVGKSSNVTRRLGQHMDGKGAAFTRIFKPTGCRLPRLGTLSGAGDGPERDETLRQMDARGAHKVRGWKFCSRKLSKTDLCEIENNIRELKDLCRRCGRSGHFAAHCRFTTDRHAAKLYNRR
jgi:hypothetical protein